MYLGIEIGGTKLQVGLGPGDGTLAGLWRRDVDVAAGPEGIRRQISAAVPELLSRSALSHTQVTGVGIGFGGPVDDVSRTIIKSHQITGWDNFPLAQWVSDLLGLRAVLGNDADVAGLAEALFGAGKGLSPIFYVTIGSGIGGGLIINGEIYRGSGRGAAEIGHLKMLLPTAAQDWDYIPTTLESVASGWAIAGHARRLAPLYRHTSTPFLKAFEGRWSEVTARDIGEAAAQGDRFAEQVLFLALTSLADAICHVITLLCPRRIIIGGGVSLMGDKVLFEPLRKMVNERVFEPFQHRCDIVPANLGEEVVVHGALALARRQLSSRGS